jgi:hypothetical protein
MGRTISSFRMVLALEKEDWKPFRNALDKKDRKKFDDMFDISSPTFQPTLLLFNIQPCLS